MTLPAELINIITLSSNLTNKKRSSEEIPTLIVSNSNNEQVLSGDGRDENRKNSGVNVT